LSTSINVIQIDLWRMSAIWHLSTNRKTNLGCYFNCWIRIKEPFNGSHARYASAAISETAQNRDMVTAGH